MLSRFFIHRPIFATVISTVIVIAGIVSQGGLPVAKYPEISPPTVRVTAFYPGANAKVVSDTVAAPVEQEVNGVEDMLYMSSTCADDGSYTLNVTFDIGTDMDMATVLVQNRVAIALPKLPQDVTRQGVTTKKQSTSIVQFITLYSDNSTHDSLFLSNYATTKIKDELSRIKGVGEVTIFGSADYSMRVWLDPRKLKARNLTTEDVTGAIQEQNVQVAAGRIGQQPAPTGTAFELTVNTLGRLQDEAQFENLIIKTTEGGRITRVKDVARVELGGKDYNRSSSYNGTPCATLSIYQLPGANALDLATQIRAKMEELSQNFEQGMEYGIPFDTTKFVEASIEEVYETLFIAVVLVVIVIFVFLQDWRTTLIPCAAIPVSLVGTFAVMSGMGFSINMLTLFGIVLAIGIVVDDAIVVVENTTRHLDAGLNSKDAAVKAMEEITGPVIATTLVLLAVFVPTAFMAGITGQLYRQFALTISGAVIISTINALTLSPALCGILMRATPAKRNFFFQAFNRVFDGATSIYSAVIGAMVRRVAMVMLLFLGLLTITGWGFLQLPTGFLPEEDQGYVFVNLQLPDGASLERTQKALAGLDQAIKDTPGVSDWVSIAGFSLLSGTNGSNLGLIAVIFDPWDKRQEPHLSQEAILAHLRAEFFQVEEAIVFAFVPPAIDGLGVAGGFQMQLQDKTDAGLAELQNAAQDLIESGNSQADLTALNTTFRSNVPQLFVNVDRTKVKTLDVPLSSVFGTLQAYLGSAYVNDFNKFGRTYQVRVQADSQYRVQPEDIARLDVRNRAGDMIPIGTFVDVSETFGPQVIQRYNLYPSAQINGEPASHQSPLSRAQAGIDGFGNHQHRFGHSLGAFCGNQPLLSAIEYQPMFGDRLAGLWIVGENDVARFAAGEERLKAIIVTDRNRIEFVRMALCAFHGDPEERFRGGIHDVDQNVVTLNLFVELVAAVASRGEKAGGDDVLVLKRQFVAGDLFQQETIERLVGLETADDVIAVPPGMRPVAIVLVPVAFTKPRDVQPVTAPTLAVLRRCQKAFDVRVGGFVGLFRRIGLLLIESTFRREPGQIQRQTPS